MSITYKIEIDNNKIDNFPEFIEKYAPGCLEYCSGIGQN